MMASIVVGGLMILTACLFWAADIAEKRRQREMRRQRNASLRAKSHEHVDWWETDNYCRTCWEELVRWRDDD